MKLIAAPLKFCFNLLMFCIIGPFWLMWMLCKAIAGRR